jgi:hypothetical protein
VLFSGQATGSDADIVNHLHGRLDFFSSGREEGPVTIGSVRNDGEIEIGIDTRLIVLRNLVLDVFGQSKLTFDIMALYSGNTTVGSIAVRGKTRLGGDLVVNARVVRGEVKRGRYRLISAPDGLTGRFRAHFLRHFFPHQQPRIVYTGNAVDLIVE